jgi:cell division protein FtsB
MTIRELTDDNRALTSENELLHEVIDQLKAEIERLNDLLNPKPEGSK